MKISNLVLLAATAAQASLFGSHQEENFYQAEAVATIEDRLHQNIIASGLENRHLVREFLELVQNPVVRTSIAIPVNLRGARWGSCGPTAPYDNYNRIVIGVPYKFAGRINNNPNDNLSCRKPFYIEVYNPKTRRWIVAKIAGAFNNLGDDRVILSEEAYALIGGTYGTKNETEIKWRFTVRQ